MPKKQDGRVNNGGKRKGAGRPPKYPPSKKPVPRSIRILPGIAKACSKRHGSLVKALEFAAFNGGREPL